MKKLSYELMKSYRNLIILFSISYMITMLFFSSYIKNAAYLDIEVINGFINYEMNGIEEKLKKGENFEEIFLEALEECPKIQGITVIFKNTGKYYSYDLKEEFINLLNETNIYEEIQSLGFYKYEFLNKKIEIDGASIFKDNILIEKINIENSLMYNILMGTAKTGILEATNPNSKSDFISLEIIDSNVKDNLSYENGAIKLIKDIEVDVSVSEIQGSLIVDSSALDYIRYNEEEYINGYVKYIFNKYKEKKLDIFDVERLAEMYFSKEDIKDPLSITELEVRTKLNIKGTGITRNSL